MSSHLGNDMEALFYPVLLVAAFTLPPYSSGFLPPLFNPASSFLQSTPPIEEPIIQDPTLLTQPSNDVIITLHDPLRQILNSHLNHGYPSRDSHINSLVSDLQGFSLMSQSPILDLIKNATGAHAIPFWISNQLAVKNATPSLLTTLVNSRLVKNITRDLFFPVMPILNMAIGKEPNGPEWGIMKINAHKLWNITQGEGIIVATIDTGARLSHTSLKNNYVGAENYGWFDPLLNADEPYDPNGHGTHTTATIAGDNGVGVAPKVKWMACKGCDAFNCFQSSLLACGQFILCPTDPQGNNPDCTKAPHIVSNSWGGGGEADFFNPTIASWQAAGIIPFFAIGNKGPGCNTTSHPGDQNNVIAVGATDVNDRLARFSSRGQNPDSVLIKPEILAPGKDINSAFFLNDNAYRIMSGTSMACPLVAGAAALLLSINPQLGYEDIRDLFYETSYRGITHGDGPQCGNIIGTEYPNHMYGHGRLDVYEAYKKMMEGATYKRDENLQNITTAPSKPPGGITITLTLPKLF
ncbi:unnamed protein product [Orchesella dallaii]|uniref:Peptidase S8/S53 domain-containing protein n=1 Tax=Orchesella dallaii TaxID=48710 RepID=A0ABP1S3P9_9HEXA